MAPEVLTPGPGGERLAYDRYLVICRSRLLLSRSVCRSLLTVLHAAQQGGYLERRLCAVHAALWRAAIQARVG
jgi:hypothetical protein